MALAVSNISLGQNTLNNVNSQNLSHTTQTDDTCLFVIVATWLQTGVSLGTVTYGGVAMTPLAATNLSNGRDQVVIYGLLAPASGTANVTVNVTNGTSGVVGSIYAIGFKGTPTTGSAWADATTVETGANAANQSVSVPNNASKDGIIDGVCIGAIATPSMGAQTNRVLGGSGNGGVRGTGFSYLVEAPSSGNQTMDWTFSSASSAQAAIRVLSATTAKAPMKRKGPYRIWNRIGRW